MLFGLGGDARFGRLVLAPVDSFRYTAGKLDEISAPVLSDERHVVSCLVYADDDRLYVEVTVKNRSRADVTFAPASVRLEEDGKPMPRLDAAREARRIESDGARPFEPVPSRVDPKTRQPVYDRNDVDRQSRRRLEYQEREAVFASLLLALGREGGAAIQPGHEKHVACAFGPRKAKSAPVEAIVDAGGSSYRFAFKP